MQYFLSLGSNLGDKRDNLLRALDALKEARVKVLGASSVYHTQPVGDTTQPWFFNQVIEVDTGLSPNELLALAKKVERNLGRRPARKSGPRTIDIDILLAGDRIIVTTRLIIPHPRMAERNFVLIPLKEIAPQTVHPVLGVDVEELSCRSGDRSLVRKIKPRRSGDRLLTTKKKGSAARRGEGE
ncbi:MAG: 2-amino-4-hydroxy-6-hydroxymethyldihydropteridine diphosphokinase [Candidatus Aminicenantes bacterium]|nr:2-amino-4-hydroxy-6-hydroxymethyldihydropteridine diphosphokinase [Candidatus Aminicenantes bacterium]